MGDTDCSVFDEWDLQIFHAIRQGVRKLGSFNGCAQVYHTANMILLTEVSTLIFRKNTELSTSQIQSAWDNTSRKSCSPKIPQIKLTYSH